MKRFGIALCFLLCPLLLYAQESSLSFAPPASDYSMVFLANLFGVVDGVLSGTGSQIIGAMFSVFNSAVLALGGIIIMYTLIVATMNTAHEGQMLGQKWSSIWIPMRSTFGLALLMPKASGYCLMQIFVMWVVTQGVGAADKVWQAALSYLNRGGVIVHAQSGGAEALISQVNGTANAVPNGAYTILAGQVCMLALQMQLAAQREMDIAKGGRCQAPNPNQASPGPLCSGEVPDFLSTVNFVSYQQQQPSTSTAYTMPMPYFSATSSNPEYAPLNGLCGQVKWNAMSTFSGTTAQTGSTYGYGKNTQSKSHWYSWNGLGDTTSTSDLVTLNAAELETAQLSRAIALQQMYMDLAAVAQVMVNNDPQINATNNSSASGEATSYSPVAAQQYGVPYTAAGAYCSTYKDGCTNWGSYALVSGTSNSNSSVLFNGTEFYNAINDYNGVMAPTLNLINQIAQGQKGTNSRAFIQRANEQGWITAGAYFFSLVNLNGNAKSAQSTDSDSGLDKSEAVALNDLNNATLNSWLNNNSTAISNINLLFQGGFSTTSQPTSNSTTSTASTVSPPNFKQAMSLSSLNLQTGQNSSTVNGFINNSLMVQLAGQPGLSTLNFDSMMSVTSSSQMFYLKYQAFGCGSVTTFVFTFCLGGLIGDVLYNGIIVTIYNALMFLFQQILEQVVMAFMMIPLQGMSTIFQDGMSTLAKPGVNPVVALAQMGEYYINFSGNMWISLLMMSISFIIVPLVGIIMLPIFLFSMPLVFSWIGIMVGIGFSTCYYVPVLPYMIFTFGALAWLMSVIEAMVAAPIVALGVTHPEGHDAFGKGEAAIMLLLNVFLRPAMMIIGYIFAISLSYVGVWILNSGYEEAINYIQGGVNPASAMDLLSATAQTGDAVNNYGTNFTGAGPKSQGSGAGGYTSWTGVYAFFFSILIYTTMYLTLVQKSFSLISYLPDKVLRWIGGSPESLGAESSQWGDENVKGNLKGAGDQTASASGQMGKQLGSVAQQGVGGAASQLGKGMGSGKVSATGEAAEATPSAAGGGAAAGEAGGGLAEAAPIALAAL